MTRYRPYNDIAALLSEKILSTIASTISPSRSCAWFDFPDHPNVGDSAIWIGERVWARRLGLESTFVCSTNTFSHRHLTSPAVLKASVAFIHGGGNFGGLYPHHEKLRYAVIVGLQSVPIVQLPQSVHFVNDLARTECQAMLKLGNSPVVLARDTASQVALEALGSQAQLCPDSVHMLGSIDAPPAKIPVLVLGRTDKESADAIPEAVDWLVERARPVQRALNLRRRVIPSRSLSMEEADRLASMRLARGVAVLAQGERVVTNRLHGALLALQMGRRVYAADPDNGKIGNYYKTWLRDYELPISFHRNLEEAYLAATQHTTD